MLCLSASRMGEHGLRDLAKVHLRERADLSSLTVERSGLSSFDRAEAFAEVLGSSGSSTSKLFICNHESA